MKVKVVGLCAAVAVIALTASGAAAVSDNELAPENETNSTAVGICVVGVDSPCNGDNADESLGDELRGDDANETDSGDRKMWIPEDQNRDGEIDERFRGDSPPEEHSHGETDDEHSHCDEETPQVLLPEDQNRDGKIDDRFGGVPEFLDRLFTSLFGLH